MVHEKFNMRWHVICMLNVVIAFVFTFTTLDILTKQPEVPLVSSGILVDSLFHKFAKLLLFRMSKVERFLIICCFACLSSLPSK